MSADHRNSFAWKLALIIISVIVLFRLSSSLFRLVVSKCLSRILLSR